MNLDEIVTLSHEFGTEDYVKGGGGNTSAKDNETLWVKPSGTTLGGLSPEGFVALNRKKINRLYEVDTPTDASEREALVRDLMADATLNDVGRPSVEAPLHNVFEATYVVHTHPVLVNGMTCAQGARGACERLFPDALWVDYIDPGYTLCLAVREAMQAYRDEHGRQPSLLFLKNHGVFVAGDTVAEVQGLYARIVATLNQAYNEAGVNADVPVENSQPDSDAEDAVRRCFGDDAAYVVSSGRFPPAPGPVSPDHLVYARAFPFTDDLTAKAAQAYRTQRGYAPKVVVAGDRVYGIGPSEKHANLALVLAKDGAQVVRLTEAFGGIDYMTDAAREFIENWEVESYRQQVAGK